MSILIKLYNSDVFNKKIFYDKAQELVLVELDNLRSKLCLKNDRMDNIFFSDIFSFLNKDDNLGLYIWGDVGRGKTYLVDLFFNSLPFNKKLRLHFHHFMKLIHDELKINSGEKDPLKIISKKFHKDYLVICLDEFFVKDIGDAMNLSKLFEYLFNFGVFLIITSNVVPNKLYEGGLQRQKFIPTIRLFEKFLKIVSLDSITDYRLIYLREEKVFFYVNFFTSFKIMKQIFFKISKDNPKRKFLLNISGRNILTYYVSSNAVWFNFDIICGSNRSHLDYVEIASSFKIVFLTGVRKLSYFEDDVARRFIALIDEFYDRKIKILMFFSSDSFLDLYNGDFLSFDFKRTISRLNEMSSIGYLRDVNNNVF